MTHAQRKRIEGLVAGHDTYRRRTLNLIASENVLSPAVRASLQSDLLGRYGDYNGRDLSSRRYRGNRYMELIEREATRIAQKTFRAEHVELRPISGHVAGAAVLMGLCQPGDLVLELGRDGGGHRESRKFSASHLVPLENEYLPFDAARYNVDAAKSLRLIEERRPRLVILGSSNFLFRHPVAVVAEALHSQPNGILVYDASHVMGFLAAGRFQDPLREGADLVFGSTHKTLPGPQGGIIFSNSSALLDAVSEAIYPALVTNHHPFRIPSLAFALLEMQQWGEAYADQMVANSQAFGQALEAEGVPCVQVDGCYSQSHTVLACVARFGTGPGVAQRLEASGIIATAAHLPEFWGVEGIRFGVQEITRLGVSEEDMQALARWTAAAITGSGDADAIAQEIALFTSGFGPIRFSWSD